MTLEMSLATSAFPRFVVRESSRIAQVAYAVRKFGLSPTTNPRVELHPTGNSEIAAQAESALTTADCPLARLGWMVLRSPRPGGQETRP